MPPSHPGLLSYDPVTGIHEERLQRLENQMHEVGTATALANQKLDDLREDLRDGFGAVKVRMDEGKKQFDLHEAALAEQHREIGLLKGLEESRANRWAWAKKAILPVLTVVGTVVATRFGEMILAFLAKLFGGH